MNRVSLPYLTDTSGISAFDKDNQYRPRLWTQAPNEIDWLYEEDNGLLLTLLEKFAGGSGRSLTQPIINWTEEQRLDIHTELSSGVNASATTFTVADPYIAIVNSFVVSPVDGEVMKVTAVNYSSNQWTVTRGYNSTAPVAKSAGAKLIAMPSFMGELSEPQVGVGRLPGESRWNAVSLVGETFKVSRMQENSFVSDGWGQVEKAVVDTMLDVRRKVGKALIFNARGTTDLGADGREYVSQGFLNYIQTGLMDLGGQNGNLTWPILNDWLEARFDPDASSTTKELVAGLTLFKAVQRMARDTNHIAEKPYFAPELGTMVYTIETDGGYNVNVMLDKYGLAVNEGLGDWGLLLDMQHIEHAYFNGFEFQWLQNIQSPRAINVREDAYVGSFSLIVKHEETHGLLRGAGGPIVPLVA